MAKKQLAKDQDKFIVRLPPGMRDRIKTKAEKAGMSMNEAVVWALERAFPAPITLGEKITELVDLVAALKGDDTYHMVDVLVGEISDTLDKISSYRIKAQPSFRDAVHDRYQQILEEEYERHRDAVEENPFEGDEPFKE